MGAMSVMDANGDKQIKLYQDGNIKAREIHVMVSSETSADYVFRDDYALMSLHALRNTLLTMAICPTYTLQKSLGSAER